MTVVVDGTNGLTFPDSSVQPSTAVGNAVQTYTNVGASRVLGTTYTNSTGRPIFICVVVGAGTFINCLATLTINGLTCTNFGCNSGTAGGACYPVITAVIPVGGTYAVSNANSAVLQSWFELR